MGFFRHGGFVFGGSNSGNVVNILDYYQSRRRASSDRIHLLSGIALMLFEWLF